MKEQKISRLNRYLCSTIEEINVLKSICVFIKHEEKSTIQSMSNYINDNHVIVVFINDENNEFECYCSRENTCEKCSNKCFPIIKLSEIRDAKLFLRQKKLERIINE